MSLIKFCFLSLWVGPLCRFSLQVRNTLLLSLKHDGLYQVISCKNYSDQFRKSTTPLSNGCVEVRNKIYVQGDGGNSQRNAVKIFGRKQFRTKSTVHSPRNKNTAEKTDLLSCISRLHDNNRLNYLPVNIYHHRVNWP